MPERRNVSRNKVDTNFAHQLNDLNFRLISPFLERATFLFLP